MRRSAAPSLASKAKRPKFVTPFKCRPPTVNVGVAPEIPNRDKCTEGSDENTVCTEPCGTDIASQRLSEVASEADVFNPEGQNKENTPSSNSSIKYYGVMW
jgi:hypothetical protein